MKEWFDYEIELIISNAKNGIHYKESAKQLERTCRSVHEKMKKLKLKFYDLFRERKGDCLRCYKKLEGDQMKFCSHSCAAFFNNLSRAVLRKSCRCNNCGEEHQKTANKLFCSIRCREKWKRDKKIQDWIEGRDLGYSGAIQNLKRFIRRHLLEKAENKCSKCGWGEINPITNNYVLEINHINGIASDCRPENLEVLCPNCHSLTPNFRSLNKNSTRKRKG